MKKHLYTNKSAIPSPTKISKPDQNEESGVERKKEGKRMEKKKQRKRGASKVKRRI